MNSSHRIKVLGRELLVRSEAPPEKVREIEAFVNAKIAEVSASVRGGDAQVIAILALMNIAEAYLTVSCEPVAMKDEGERISRLLQRLDDVVENSE